MASLALAVGCTFELETIFSIPAIIQVAPGPGPGVRMRSEAWETGCDHHGYVDLYGNRCERFEIPAGASRVDYEAELLPADAADVIDPKASVRRRASRRDDRLHDAQARACAARW